MKVVKPDNLATLSSQEQIKQTLTFMSQSNSTGKNNAATRKILVYSDSFTVRLIKAYVEPLNFQVKHLIQPSSLIQEIQDAHKRILFFDQDYSGMVLKYIQKFKKQRQFKLVSLKCKSYLIFKSV